MPHASPAPALLASSLRRLAGLSPFGPIFGKELRTTARRRRSYVLRVFYLAALLLVLLAAWAGSAAPWYGQNSVAARAQAQAQLGAAFFMCFSLFSVSAMAAIGPVLTSTAISAERLGKTLHVLLMTPITAWQVVAGKLLSRLLVALTLIGLSLPVLALVRLLGGVELWQMVGVVSVCAATALSAAALGLLFSTFINPAYAAILMSYAATLFLYAFIPFVLVAGMGVRAAPWLGHFTATNPFMCAAMLGEPRAFAGSAGSWVPFVFVHTAFAAVLVTCSAAALRRVARREGGEGSPPAAAGAPVEPGVSAAPGAPDAATGAAADGAVAVGAARGTPHAGPGRREVSDHPVLWRELRRPLMARKWQAVVGSAVTVALLLVTYAVVAANNGLAYRGTQQAYACIFNGLFWLLTAVLSATAIAQEKESDTWTLLLTTPLSGRAIVWGKVLGLYRRLAWPGILFSAHLLVFAAFGVISVIGALLVVWLMFSFNTLWVAAGVWLSLRLKKVTFAVIANLLLAVALYLGVFAVLVIIGGLFRYRDLPSLAAWYTPYHYIVYVLEPPGSYVFSDYGRVKMLGGGSFDYVEFAALAFVAGVAHVLLSAAILSATARAFDRIVGRAGGPPTGPRTGAQPLRLRSA